MNLALKANTFDFSNRRFGMFVHMGVYSMLGGEFREKTAGNDLGEWIMNCLQIPVKEYEKIASEFNPVNFNACKLVKLARRCGMRYIVMTTKHHDGFAMFRSDCDPYNIYDWTGCKRDIVAELALACRRQNMKLGLYYSHALDWHEEHAGGWAVKPYGLRNSYGNVWDYPDNRRKDFSKYFEKKVKPQVVELLQKYGDIFLVWFDTPHTITPEQSEELYLLVKKLQPGCLINSRIGNGKGDYFSLGDNQIPTAPSIGKPCEAPVTLNDTWGYKNYDNNWKTSEDIIEMLVKLASKNVNLLLNIGPRGDGSLPNKTVEILSGVSKWTELHTPALCGTSGNPSPNDFPWGYITVDKTNLYLFLKENKAQIITLKGLKTKAKRIYSLDYKQPVSFNQTIDNDAENFSLKIKTPETNLHMPVLKVECDENPLFEECLQVQSGVLQLYPLEAELYSGSLKNGNEVYEEDRYLDYRHYGKMRIKTGGILTGWSKADEYLQWTARFGQAGIYTVEIITSGAVLDDKTRKSSEVILMLSNHQELKSNLTQHSTYTGGGTSKKYFAVTFCGRVNIQSKGEYKIKIKLSQDLPGETGGIPLVAVKFCLDEF